MRGPAGQPRPTKKAPGTPARLARVTLAILTFCNLLNYLDRFVVSALAESLKRSELSLSDTQLGLLMTSFVLVFMLAAPVFGALGDRGPRQRLLSLGILVWSLATAAAGFARSFAGLVWARAAVGVGEAAYGTIAPGLLADLFPRARRGRALAVFFSAIPIGSALGYVVGGLLDHALGWRAAFFVAGGPGLLVALLCLRLTDPPRGAQDDPAMEEARAGGSQGVLSPYRELVLHNRTYLLTVLGYAAYTFAIGGMAFWMPSFLERVRGVPARQATVQFGAIVVATGFVGTFAGGWLGDALVKRTRQAYLWLSGAGALLAAPLSLIVFTDPRPAVYLPAAALAELFLFASTGPINSTIVNVVRPGQRATAVALSILTIHLFGDVPSPPLIGRISDLSSLEQAVRVVPLAVLVAGAIWTLEAWLGARGSRRPGTRAPRPTST